MGAARTRTANAGFFDGARFSWSRLSRVRLRNIEGLVSGERGDRLDSNPGLRCGCVHADPPAVPAVIRRLVACGLMDVAAGLEIPGDTRLERQAHTAV